ncbi:diguanylate cyclase [Rubripirellula amarantea]|nr:diguanylate cyclase [Rubripirellula amarantea]
MTSTNLPNATAFPSLEGIQTSSDAVVITTADMRGDKNPSVGLDETMDPILAIEEGRQRVGKLLAGLQESAPRTESFSYSPDDVRFENHLAVVRLGIATSLFYALRTKHAATAAHCLRVALSCSAWAERMKLDDETRDRIEVAALLHDLGKIGIPDRILRKPGKLSVDEQMSMELNPPLGVEILRGCTSDNELLDIVLHANAWYESRRHGEGPRGDAIPFGSRMLAIVDAFDSMTTDTVYRPALSRERAIEELINSSRTQFDPELVLDFSRMLEERPEILQGCVVNRWLKGLDQSNKDTLWTGPPKAATPSKQVVRRESLYYQQLLGNMSDGVVFTDAEGVITEWNHGMEAMTGIPSSAIVGKRWAHESLRLRQPGDNKDDEACLVEACLRSNSVVKQAMLIEQPGNDPTPVHLTVAPVMGLQPGVYGTVTIVRDMSDQKTLQRQLETLHKKSTMDPLTQVANRSHFDDRLEAATRKATLGKSSFSLIICDIDHFKSVNDVHGHPAGDEALKSFAAVLKMHSRDGDLVARYGGEEFLLLTPNCDNATASQRAEAIRAALEKTPLASLNDESVTASFGVTEFQPGDTPESVLARADRALLKAKDNGRNRVIQLGAGNKVERVAQDDAGKFGWLQWLGASTPAQHGEFDIITPVPVDLAIEKLRGFIADHGAEIISVKENQLAMKVNAYYTKGGRRRADQQIAIQVQLTLSDANVERASSDTRSVKKAVVSHTNVHVHLTPIRNRDRRNREVSTCFNQVINSLKCYLMGEVKRCEG